MKGPSDKRLKEMHPRDRHIAIRKYIFNYMDWLMATAHYRVEHEDPLTWLDEDPLDAWDHVADDYEQSCASMQMDSTRFESSG